MHHFDNIIFILENLIEIHEKKSWFNKKPMTLYHGSPNNFTSFDINKSGSTNDYGMYGKGVYLTPEKDAAKSFGGEKGSLHTVRTTLKNPLHILSRKHLNKTMKNFHSETGYKDNKINNKPTQEYSEKFSNYLQSKGYDGIIDHRHGRGTKPVKDSKTGETKERNTKWHQVVSFNPNKQTKIVGTKNYNLH